MAAGLMVEGVALGGGFSNSGNITVDATASFSSSSGSVFSDFAVAGVALSGNGSSLTSDITNSGTVSVSVNIESSASATSSSIRMSQVQIAGFAIEDWDTSGTFTNSGTIEVNVEGVGSFSSSSSSSSGMSSMSGGIAALAIMSSNIEGGIVNSGTIIGMFLLMTPIPEMCFV